MYMYKIKEKDSSVHICLHVRLRVYDTINKTKPKIYSNLK